MRCLVVGDVHAKPGDLDDCRRLADFVHKTAIDQEVDYVIWLGDQNHTHAILHVDVLGFWREVFARTDMQYEHIILVGNHDLPGTGSGNDAMQAFDDMATTKVCRQPTILDGILLMPYYGDHDAFVKYCQDHPTETVICHQTFDGSQFENGFYAKDGINPNLIPQKYVISGHIHAPQRVGKVWYPGAPRWQTLSDANVNRAIWVVNFDTTRNSPNPAGTVIGCQDFDTGMVCRKIYHLEATPKSFPAQSYKAILKDIDIAHIDLTGPDDWILEAKDILADIPQARVRVFREQNKTKRIRESQGITKAFAEYLKDFKPPNGTSLEDLEKMVADRVK